MEISSKSHLARRGFWQGVQGRLILLLLLLFIPILLVQTYSYYERFHHRRDEELQANLEVARAVAKTFEAFTMDIVHSELVLCQAMSIQSVTDEQRKRILDDFRADNPVIRSVFWMNSSGLVIDSSPAEILGYDLSDRSFFIEVLTGRTWAISELILGRSTGKPAFTISRGIRNPQGELLGVVAAAVEPDRLRDVFDVERSKGAGVAGKDAGVSILDPKGMLVYRFPESIHYDWDQRNWLKHFPAIERSLRGEEVTGKVQSHTTGKIRLVGFAPIPSVGWVAAASRAEEDVIVPIIAELVLNGALFLCIALAALAAAIIISRFISTPIKKLREQVVEFGRGESEVPIIGVGPIEVRDLADSFNTMTAELRSRERSLRDQREFLEVTLTSIGDAVLATDIEERTTFLNPIAAALTGWKLEDAVGKPISEVFSIINEKTRKPAENIVERVLGEGVIVNLANNTALIARDGREIPIEDSAAPIRDSSGNIIGVVLVFHDVAEKRRAQEALRESEEKYRRLFENIQEIVTVYEVERNAGGQIVERRLREANPAFLRSAGVSSVDEIRGKTSLEIFGKSWSEELLPAVQHAMDTGEVCVQEVYRPESDRCYLTTIVPLDESMYIGTGWDITERKKADEALRRREEEFRALVENAPDVISLFSSDLRRLYVNSQVRENTGRDASFMMGKSLAEAGYPDSFALPLNATLQNVIATGKEDTVELSYEAPKGRIWLQVRCAPLRSADGSVESVMSIGRDITDRKRMEEELRQSHAELESKVLEKTAELRISNKALMDYAAKLERSNQELEEFAFVASHDLQEPLRKIQTFGSLLIKRHLDGLNEQAQAHLTRITASAKRMSDSIHSLLDYSLITSDPCRGEPVDLGAAVREVAKGLEADINRVRGSIQITSDLPAIEADSVKIKKVLQHLIEHSIKFRKEDEPPTLRIYGETLGGTCSIFFEDNGIGFDEKFLDLIFRPFQQLHTRGKYEGIGMGLALCRKIVERHEGSISARSMPGRGATFIIRLPLVRIRERI